MSNKLKNIKLTHGAKSLDSNLDVLPEKIDSHKTSLAAKYQDKLGSLTLEELKEIAAECGLLPVDNRDLLIKSLRKEFKKV